MQNSKCKIFLILLLFAGNVTPPSLSDAPCPRHSTEACKARIGVSNNIFSLEINPLRVF